MTTTDKTPSNDSVETRRLFPRRGCDKCVGVIDGQTYPVENWSQGGLLLNVDDRMFGVNQNVEVTLKFKLGEAILDVDHSGAVIRKSEKKLAIRFNPVTRAIRHRFQQVIDDYITREFADSQIV